MYGFDVDRNNRVGFDERGTDHNENKGKSCIQNIIIDPKKSAWYPSWKFLIHCLLLFGFFNDPYHIAFDLSYFNMNGMTKEVGGSDMSLVLVIDYILTIDILINLVTVFPKEVNQEIKIIDIMMNYIKGFFVMDFMASVPALFLDQNSNWFWLKLIRFIHARSVYSSISDTVKSIFTRCGLDKGSVEKTSYIVNLIIYMLSAIHILGCTWIYIGKTTPCSWLDQEPDHVNEFCRGGIPVKRDDDFIVYFTADYYIITTLTTVGYGDYKGYTPSEYLFQMIVEFLGIGIFSYLMGSINNLVGSESTLQDIIDERIEKIETWLRKLEKARNKNFSKQLYDSIKEYTEISYYIDFW